MASIIIRKTLPTITRPYVMLSAVRHCKMMADPLEHATGLEKREMLAAAAGNDDPYHVKVLKRGPGTKEQPTKIPSVFESRIIGCICEEDATVINYMWLHEGEPKRCECGYWFDITRVKPL